MCSTASAEIVAVVTDGGTFVVERPGPGHPHRGVRPVASLADVALPGVRLTQDDRLHTDAERAHHVR